VTSILVFGATGQIGRFLLPRLVASNERVFAVSRNPPASEASQPVWIRGDFYAALAPPPPCDTICSLGPLDAFADWFERHPPAGVRRVLAFSSMSAESKRDSTDLAERELARRLRDAEARLAARAQAHGIAWTIFRPTLIYGAGMDRSLAPIARFAQRWHVLPIPMRASGLRQPVHAADLAQACVAAFECAATYGKTYALGGGERLRFDAMLMRLRAALPNYTLALPVPVVALRIALSLRARMDRVDVNANALQRLHENLVADNSAAQRDFGFAPRNFVAADVLATAQARRDG
jgi:nucleoside-diphosphate-sugar epimerase